jgi:inorganic pyrophosphatase
MLKRPDSPGLHPWHDLAPGPRPPEIVTVVVEIPTNSRNKYELDKPSGLFKLDRVLHSSVHYPGCYGFIPRTYAEDDDPLDVLVMTTIPLFTGCLVDVRPVGVFHLIDKGRNDEKIIAVPLSDPYAEPIRDLPDLAPHALREIEHFFQVYKNLEGGTTVTQGFEPAAKARAMVTAGIARYRDA